VANPYAALLRVRGGAAFSLAGLVARLPLSMLTVVIVLLVSSTTGSYGLGGLAAAVYTVPEALAGPLTSRWADTAGQHRVLPWLAGANVAALLGFVALADAHAPLVALLGLLAVAGAAQPNVGALVRSRWAAALGGSAVLTTAFSWESVADEVVFTVGPVLVTALAAALGPSPALLVTLGFTVVGTAALTVLRASEPAPHPRGPRSQAPGVAGLAGMWVLVVALTANGFLFGVVQVAVIAFTGGQAGHPLEAGVILAAWSVGSMGAGIVYGAMHPGAPLARQLGVLAALVPVSVLVLPFLRTGVGLGVGLALSGLVVAPVLIVCTRLIERIAPVGRLTEALAWVGTGLTLGFAAGSAVGGVTVQRLGTTAAFVVAVVGGLLTTAAAWGGRRWLPAD